MSRRAPLIAGILVAILAILAVVLLVIPKMSEVNKAKDELSQAEQQQGALEAELRSLQEAKVNAPDIEKELEKVQTQVPPTADLPGMIRLISGAAGSSGIDFFSIAPQPPVADASGEFTVIPTQITVNGEFFSLDEFLFRLETLPRAVKVVSFQVAQGPDFVTGGPAEPLELQIAMTAEFYTTDSSAGPGSIPGPNNGSGGAVPPPVTSPTPQVSLSPTPEVSLSPTPTPTPTASASPSPSPSTQGG